MPHRRLTSSSSPRLRLDLFDRLGEPVSVTISEDPGEFRERAWRQSALCPICGESTSEGERLPASLHPKWASGLSVGVGVWVHRACFEACPEADEPSPIPW